MDGAIRVSSVDSYARLRVLSLVGARRQGVIGWAQAMSVHQEQHGRSGPLQRHAHGDVSVLWRHSQIGRRLPLDALVGLVLVLRERLAVLETAEEPNEEPEENERRQARNERQAFDIQAGAHVPAVQEHVSLDVCVVGAGIGVLRAPLPGQRAAVEVPQGVRVLHGVDLLSRTHVLAIFIGFIEDLILPHVEVQDEDQEDDAVVEPFP